MVARVVFEVVIIVQIAYGFGDMVAFIADRQLWKVPPPGCEARARVSVPRRSLQGSLCQ
jgi:hypothetical protein